MNLTLTQTRQNTWVSTVAAALFGSLLLALASQLAIPLPFSPVPIVLANTLAVFLGVLMGPKTGALTVVFYLIEGACGLPVFSMGGATLAWLAGPTGGYLFGYVAGAAVAGWIAQRGHLLLALVAGHLAIFALGVPYLAAFVGWQAVLFVGFFPFLPGGLLKSLLLATFFRSRLERA